MHHRDFLNNELTDVLSRLQLEVYGANDGDQSRQHQYQEVPPDDRTIFLTFSKGYPLTEYEVQEFFTRRFGDCFEAIYKQEVSARRVQPLYAHLVLRPGFSIDAVLDGKSRAKFSINASHAWARKFEKKILRSPSVPISVTRSVISDGLTSESIWANPARHPVIPSLS